MNKLDQIDLRINVLKLMLSDYMLSDFYRLLSKSAWYAKIQEERLKMESRDGQE